jgi:hypothetical protein
VTESYCVWWSPLFTWVGTFPIPDPNNFNKVSCYGCANLSAYFVLTLATLRNNDTGAVINRYADLVVQYTSAFSQGTTGWRPVDGDDAFDCLGVNEMSLASDSFHFGGDAGPYSPFCCDGVPTTVFLLPL